MNLSDRPMHSHKARLIGAYIIKARGEKGILQQEMADELEISAQFLGKMEKGDVPIPEILYDKAMAFLNASEAEIRDIKIKAAKLETKDDFKRIRALKRKKRQKRSA